MEYSSLDLRKSSCPKVVLQAFHLSQAYVIFFVHFDPNWWIYNRIAMMKEPYSLCHPWMSRKLLPILFSSEGLSLMFQCRTESQLRTYITSQFLPNAPKSDIDKLFTLYPGDITKGSPFDTGILNALTPQYKRIAAILGDVVFQSPRRFFLQNRTSTQNTWSFCRSIILTCHSLVECWTSCSQWVGVWRHCQYWDR